MKRTVHYIMVDLANIPKEKRHWFINEGHIKTIVGATFPLSEAGKAQHLSQSGHGRGRIVLHVA